MKLIVAQEAGQFGKAFNAYKSSASSIDVFRDFPHL
jgi:hypothetical protein